LTLTVTGVEVDTADGATAVAMGVKAEIAVAAGAAAEDGFGHAAGAGPARGGDDRKRRSHEGLGRTCGADAATVEGCGVPELELERLRSPRSSTGVRAAARAPARREASLITSATAVIIDVALSDDTGGTGVGA